MKVIKNDVGMIEEDFMDAINAKMGVAIGIQFGVNDVKAYLIYQKFEYQEYPKDIKKLMCSFIGCKNGASYILTHNDSQMNRCDNQNVIEINWLNDIMNELHWFENQADCFKFLAGVIK